MGIRNIHLMYPGDNPQPNDVAPPSDITVTDNGDDTFTVTGNDTVVQMISPTRFQISTSQVVDNGDGTYTATSA